MGAPASAASPWQNLADPVFVRADTRELPEAAVMSLAEDSRGFLWVGTQGGLARFDGYHFRSYLPNPSDPKALPDGYLRTILPAADGGLWIGSSSNGLVRFDAASETFRTWRSDPAGRKGPRSASIDALAAAGGGALWVGGDGGLDRFDPAAGTFTAVKLAASGQQPVVWTVLADRAGTLWAGTQSGLYYRPARAKQFRPFALIAGRPAAAGVYSLAEDAAGRLWAGSVNAVYEVDPARQRTRAFTSATDDAASVAPGQQWSIIEMRPGELWVGTDTAVSIIDEGTGHVRRVETDVQNPGGLTGGRVLQFLRDRSGAVWLANHVGGLLLYNPLSRGLFEVSGTRPQIGFGEQGTPALAAVPGDRLWVGGLEGHLAEFDAHTAASRTSTLPNHAAVQTLLAGNDGTLWIGTTNGLCRIDPHETGGVCPARPSQLAAASIYALLEHGHTLWVGGNTGLFCEDETTGKVTPFAHEAAFSNRQVRVLYLDRRRRLWVGTENGLNRLDPGGRIVRYAFTPGDPNSLGPGGMASIFEDRRGRIWAGAAGGPLNVLQDEPNGSTRIRQLGIADGLPHENVNGLAEDPAGRIWASTDKGIALIDPDTLRASALGVADGVSEGAYWAGTVAKSADGTIFFGGLEGITIVAPGATSPWDYAPPLVVSALQLGRRSVPAADVNRGDATVELPADARDIDLEFSSLDYSEPQALRYAYKLEGYDREWVESDAQHRVAIYTHLAPGDYTLAVRGTNRRGVWSSHIFRLGIRALPAWYETWWFRVFIAAIALVAASGAHLVRTAVLRRRQHELETIVEDRTRELSEANEKLQELSLSDPLTGLRNRRFLAQHLESDIALSLRRYEDWRADPSGEQPLDADILFFLVDLDHFKDVNDRYGHHAGDVVLVQMRERLQEVFRDSDFVVRWGGDEFLTVARGSRRSDAAMIAERVREAVGSRVFSLGGEATIAASVSVGFAAFPFIPSMPQAVAWLQVVGLADQALYMAKEAGRDTWVGLAATSRTDPDVLARFESAPEELVRAGALEVVTRGETRA